MRALLTEDVAWVVRRLPQKVVMLLKAHPDKLMLAGGFIRACIAKEDASDVDLFYPDSCAAKTIAATFAAENKRSVFSTDNACTVSIGRLPVQFIHRWTFATILECISSFDFTIASAAICWTAACGGRWLSACDDRFYEDVAAKRLVYRTPVGSAAAAGGSVLRMLKFYHRGYRITLPSLGSLLARVMASGVDLDRVMGFPSEAREEQLSRVLTGLLVEVDPNAVLGNQTLGE